MIAAFNIKMMIPKHIYYFLTSALRVLLRHRLWTINIYCWIS